MMDWLNRLFCFFLLGTGSIAHAQFSGRVIFPDGYPEKSNAVVYVESAAIKGNDKTIAVITQKDMQFLPFLTVTPVGSTVIFKNEDPHLHTVKAESGPLKNMKLAMTPVKHQYERVVRSSGYSELLCDIHSQMRAYVVVVPNRLFAVTDEAGVFQLPGDLPPPPFEIKVWHEVLPSTSVLVRSSLGVEDAKEIKLKTWAQGR